MNNKYEKLIYSNTDMLSEFCFDLFKSTPISFFDYGRFYDNGKAFSYSTSPEAEVNVFKFLPAHFELEAFRALGQRVTYMSHMLDIPPGVEIGDRDKYLINIDRFSKDKVYHRLYFVDRFQDYYRVTGFGVSREENSVFNYYLNSVHMLDRFISHFESQMREQINDTIKNQLIFLPGYLERPSVDQVSLFTEKYLSPEIISACIKEQECASRLMFFTRRESDCVELIASGYTMKAAARKLGISPRTVEQHIRNVKEKHGLFNKQQVVELWHTSGCVI